MALTIETKIYLKKIPKTVTVQRTRISGHSKKTAQFTNFDACRDEDPFSAPAKSRNHLIKVSLKKGIIRYEAITAPEKSFMSLNAPRVGKSLDNQSNLDQKYPTCNLGYIIKLRSSVC
jgi:hypothetical protein